MRWALAAGGNLGVGNDPRYFKSRCFEAFPFPDVTEAQKACIRDLAEQLDAHRKRQQAQHPKLTLTNMYNVLQKVRAATAAPTPQDPSSLAPPRITSIGKRPEGSVSRTPSIGKNPEGSAPALTAKEKTIHEQGLISILKQLHDDLDTAVFDAYGWPSTLSDEEILQNLVDLNAERAAEEASGHVRWLRPTYQAPDEVQATQSALIQVRDSAKVTVTSATQPWPKGLKERVTAVRAALTSLNAPADVNQVAAAFNGRRSKKRLSDLEEILEMLVMLGQAVDAGGGRYA